MIFCLCAGVTDEAIEAAIESGARTVAQVSRMTGAARHCGPCREALAEVVRRRIRPEPAESPVTEP
ncbi:MAG: hypothetical protein KatS3mg076_2529 [Candidatus Binatia bacterium]|nr:MAG: hypothetical protein KatS3mg076_2529 [Candidatus Binatia bacterium]